MGANKFLEVLERLIHFHNSDNSVIFDINQADCRGGNWVVQVSCRRLLIDRLSLMLLE